jgi:hypothetical protein
LTRGQLTTLKSFEAELTKAHFVADLSEAAVLSSELLTEFGSFWQ